MAVAASTAHQRFLKTSSLTLRTLSYHFIRGNSRVAHFSAGSPSRGSHEETPITSHFVKHSATVWPDAVLGIFSPNDPRFCLPGNIGLGVTGQVEKSSDPPRQPPDILTRPSCKEQQAQVLYTASDYIHFTPGAVDEVCSGILDTFPDIDGMKNFEISIHDAPRLLKKESQSLFPDRDIMSGNLSVICFSQKTSFDMSTWSEEVENEREILTEQFITIAKEICGRLRNENYWSDFIDPSCGKPYLGVNTNTSMLETDEKYRLLGFRIEDLGCCKVICHRDFGRNVFVGTIFTNAHPSTGVIDDILAELNHITDENL